MVFTEGVHDEPVKPIISSTNMSQPTWTFDSSLSLNKVVPLRGKRPFEDEYSIVKNTENTNAFSTIPCMSIYTKKGKEDN